MYKFNDAMFSIITSEKNIVIYGIKSGKIYFLNQTSKYIFEQTIQGKTIEEIISTYGKLNQLDTNIINTDFINMLSYFCKEEILING